MESKYKELSNNDLIFTLKESKLDELLIKECISRNSLNINHLLNKMAKDQKEIIEIYKNMIDLPDQGEILFFPNKDSFEFGTIPENCIIHIPENKKRTYKSINDDPDFSLKLKVRRTKDSLLEYALIEQKENRFSQILKNTLIGNVAMATVSISMAVMVFDSVSHVNKNKINQNISIVEDVSFLDNYKSAINDLNAIGFDSKRLDQLTNKDISLILNLSSEVDQNNSALEFEIKKEEVIDSIKNVIKPYIKDNKKVSKIANAIYESSMTRKVDYALFLSIMKVETTTFSQNKISSTGDVSIAQIKPEVWEDEFNRLKKEPLDVERLKKDASYAIERMGEILELQNKHKEKDPLWYARYHSKTPSLKMKYALKVQKEYLKIKSKQVDEVETKLDYILAELYQIKESDQFSSFLNKDRIENFRVELLKLKKIILENKEKGLKKLVARL